MVAKPKSIILIHGLWMTPLCWDKWQGRYEAHGYKVIAPAWPGLEGDIDGIRKNPDAIAGLGIREIVDHFDQIIRALDEPPIIMGHSFGGIFTQILTDRGLGVANVAVTSAPVKGVLSMPLSTLRTVLPVISKPSNTTKAEPLTPEQFHFAFGNLLSEKESNAVYDRYTIPAPNHLLFQASLANFNKNASTTVNYRNDNRPPLLMIAGDKDNITPSSMVKANFNLYAKSKAKTDYKEFPNQSHYIIGEPGWEDVADYALNWALEAATLSNASKLLQ